MGSRRIENETGGEIKCIEDEIIKRGRSKKQNNDTERKNDDNLMEKNKKEEE